MTTAMGLGLQNSPASSNCMKDFDVALPPEDTVSSLAFSPPTMNQTLLVAGSWDNNVRCWEVEASGKTIPKSIQTMQGPVLDVCWIDDGSKIFIAGSENIAKCWDLSTNQSYPIASHDAPVKTCHWIKTPSYSCLMTGSWDRTLKFWDTRTPQPISCISLPERCYCADVKYPMAIVGTASKNLIVYQLDCGPQEYSRPDYPLKLQMRCVSIFMNKENRPTGYAVGSVEGKVAIQYIQEPSSNFTFKCHRTESPGGCQEIYAVNDIAFHPVHGTLATVGSDGRFIFWDKDSRTRLHVSDFKDQSISKCAISNNGQIFAYAVGYDWSKGHEYNDPSKKTNVFLRPCCQELKPMLAPRYKI
ncbi:protein Rae1-like isoform X2 [Halyomorpha halys]